MSNSSNSSVDRRQLLETLHRESRQAGAMGTLFSQTVAEHVGLNATDMESLDFLTMYGPMTAGRLAEITGLTTGAITGVVDRLEAAGYVRRERDPRDRRRVMLQPQIHRYSDFEPYYDPLYQRMNELLERYSDAELAFLREYYLQVNHIFTEEIARVRGMEETKTAATSEEG